MFGTICGDVIGSTFEFNNHKSKEYELLTVDSQFTDDTVCTLALASWLMTRGGKTWPEHLRDFCYEYQSCGFGGMFKEWVMSKNAKIPIGPYASWGNGAPMRTSPIGWWFDTEAKVMQWATIQACATHNEISAIIASQIISQSIFLLRNGAAKDVIRKIAERFYDMNFTLDEIRDDYKFEVSSSKSVPQAIMAFLEGSSFEDTIRNATSIGGDSDTIAAMAGSLAEAHYPIPKEIRDGVLAKLPGEFCLLIERFEAAVK